MTEVRITFRLVLAFLLACLLTFLCVQDYGLDAIQTVGALLLAVCVWRS